MKFSASKIKFKETTQLFANFIKINKICWKDFKWKIISLLFLIVFIAIIPFIFAGVVGLITDHFNSILETREINNHSYILIAIISAILLFTNILQNTEEYIVRNFTVWLDHSMNIKIREKIAELDIARHEQKETKDLLHFVEEKSGYVIFSFIQGQVAIIKKQHQSCDCRNNHINS